MRTSILTILTNIVSRWETFQMRSIKEQIRNVLPSWFIAIRRHRNFHGAFPDLFKPKTFNEKVLYRILFDRRPLLTQITDKIAVRSFVASRLGSQILPRLHYLTTRPHTIPFDRLPDQFVVKPSHGSGWVQVVTDKAALDRDSLIEICAGWLKKNYYEITREWVYKDIKPQIMVEEFIDDGSGAAPNDYKLYVFNGQVEFIQVDAGRFTEHRRRLYTPAWEKMDVLIGYDDIRGEMRPPAHLAEMLAAAENLGRDIDFVRADFYDTAHKLYFGELTTSPDYGLGRFRPKEFDRYLGGRWTLPSLRH